MITASNDDHRMSNDYLAEHIVHLKAGPSSDRTIASRQSVCRALNNWLPFGLAFAATEQIEAWLAAHRQAGRSRHTLNVYAYHVQAFYQWACAAQLLDGNPSASIRQPTKPRCIPNPITEAELSRALEAPEPIRTAVILAAFEGLRVSEIAACERAHLTAETLIVPSGKGGDPDVVPMHPYVWAELSGRPLGRFILDNQGRPVTGHWITVHARTVFDRLGLPDVHPHRLRHRYGTLIQDMQGDIRVTQKCLRHRRVTSTEGYTLVSDAKRDAAVKQLPIPRKPDTDVTGEGPAGL